MSISTSPVQQKAANVWSSGATITVTGISSPTNGNFGVLWFDASVSTNGISSITQTGATWAQAPNICSTNRRAEVWYTSSLFSSAGTTITVNLNYTPVTTSTQSASFTEWSGVASSSQLDVSGQNNSASSSTVDSGTISPTAGRNALMIVGARFPGDYSSGPTGSFTGFTSPDGSRGYGAYQVVATTSGTYQCTWTTASGGALGVAYAVFNAPSGSSPKNLPPNLLASGVL